MFLLQQDWSNYSPHDSTSGGNKLTQNKSVRQGAAHNSLIPAIDHGKSFRILH